MRKKISTEEFRRGSEKRRHLFVSLGLAPLQVALCVSLLTYVFSMVAAVLYYWSQAEHLKWLVMPALLVVIWSFQFNYVRREFRGSAIATGISLLFQIGHLTSDAFCLIGSLGRIMVVVFALVIYAKMKDPIFSRMGGA